MNGNSLQIIPVNKYRLAVKRVTQCAKRVEDDVKRRIDTEQWKSLREVVSEEESTCSFYTRRQKGLHCEPPI